MRILISYISRIKTYTGANHFTKNFFTYFKNTSHTILGVTFDEATKGEKLTLRKGEDEGRETIWAGINFSAERLYALAEGKGDEDGKEIVRRIAEAMKELRPDVFFLNGLSTTANILFLAAQEAKVPIVTVFHGLWFLEGEAYSNISKERIDIRVQAEKKIAQESDRCIFFTPFTLHMLEGRIGEISPDKVRFIPLPYHEEYREHAGKRGGQRTRGGVGTLRIGMVGRWDPIKNHHAYLELAQEARKRGLPWEFFSVTDPTSENIVFKDIYDAYVQEIHVLPHMTIQELKTFYRSIDILIVPSHFETFCGVALEALLQGTPVVISQRVGVADIFRKYGLERWIVDISDIHSVLNAIQTAAREEVSESVRENIIRDLSPEQVFRQYEAVFSDVVHEREKGF